MSSDQYPGQQHSGQSDEAFWSRFGQQFGDHSNDQAQVDQPTDATQYFGQGNASSQSSDGASGYEPTRQLPAWQGDTPVQSGPYNPQQGWTAEPATAFSTTAAPADAGVTQTSASTAQTRSGRRSLASLAAVAVLAAGVGGGSALAVDHHGATAGASASTSASTTTSSSSSSSGSSTVTKVVQGSSSNPDWTATSAVVEKSVVSIVISSGSSEAEGTGVIIDNQGHIVTNNHVVSSVSGTIKVEIGNAAYTATIVGTDASTDLAVLKVANLPSTVQPITFADSSAVKVGQAVMAVGNPLGLSETVTTGIVSALNRPVVTQQVTTSASSISDGSTSSGNVYTNAIQTSAPINPGNSGGALVNANGELVGINSSIASLSSSSSTSESGSIGIGFAIPSNQVKYIADQLIAKGTAAHAYLGVSTSDGTATQGSATIEGAQVTSVSSGTPAATAGLKTGDVVTGLNGTTVDSSDALVAQIRALKVGDKVTLTVLRSGQQVTLTATLGTAPTSTSTTSGSTTDGSSGSGSGSSGSSSTNPWGQPGR